VDLGANFYARANVAHPERVFVDVGLGFFLELTHNEAMAFIDDKTKLLEKKAEILTGESSKIKSNIKLVLHALRELQGLKTESTKASFIDL
jgi:prefoldin alpha subunit